MVSLHLGPEEQQRINAAITGDSSLALSYKKSPVAVLSWASSPEELNILQLQGSKSGKSYRGSAGVDWVELLVAQFASTVSRSSLPVRRITMVAIENIPGMEYTYTTAIERYKRLVSLLAMSWSQQENKFVKDLR